MKIYKNLNKVYEFFKLRNQVLSKLIRFFYQKTKRSILFLNWVKKKIKYLLPNNSNQT